ncbi:hypothetical protein ACFQ48_04775 [Hymenobacter caeli]|uniref:DUF4265 domain-containing protein n=1 Tax=Hymenobacter caeli TaxID=2735894 RepID=A0ABX2FQ24_9BACT|nr:hypothetical protein [Hymenobacter caeli]NRT19273.1 hypothetical protein [Hymenobacter caeli]
MKNGCVKFEGTSEYDGSCSFTVTIVTHDTSASADFWDYTDAFQDFGRALVDFPINSEQKVIFQSGKDDGTSYPFFLLEAYCISPLGDSALRVVVDNKEPLPRKRRVEFSILAEAASLNELGRKLVSWQIAEENTIDWEAQTS